MDGVASVGSYHEVCGADDLWIGDMEAFEVAGRSIILVNVEGIFKAFANMCPHQAVPLAEGRLDGCVLTCRAHLWEFDVRTGLGINPSNKRLAEYPVRIVDGMVQVGDTRLRFNKEPGGVPNEQ
jgi:toluene monooxygenase system ferredoxin subunit